MPDVYYNSISTTPKWFLQVIWGCTFGGVRVPAFVRMRVSYCKDCVAVYVWRLSGAN